MPEPDSPGWELGRERRRRMRVCRPCISDRKFGNGMVVGGVGKRSDRKTWSQISFLAFLSFSFPSFGWVFLAWDLED